MNSSHYFIAIPLPASLREKLAGWQRELKPELPFKQWVHPEDLHITLKFLGAVDDQQLNRLINSMQQIENFNVFTLPTGTLGTFGNPKSPRVLWAGAERHPELLRLQQNIEGIAVQTGFKHEKRAYSPHITLAKKWTGKPIDVPNLKNRFTERQSITVNQIVLYRIQPDKNPKYTVETVFDFSGGGD
ncbi:RNA 2',3'-cyclic phosphodiesterase [Lentibacillus amyloliquefaciens]|uniref:RNA 2',3'-cyclic phosphodiesterase n=1 Tax=Lentibacillus amyloliquefaciens TaxID=1472767 RepID=A0A0U4DSW2_9BACI|nr:RNA 2',3'-cyclic phosphodiesterase [Lentibacillus amyloliquefaciens]ALX48424.1 2'-5' RNA ligase [Lentibacillus amyloliquefaciens]